MKTCLFVAIFVLLGTQLSAQTYYVSVAGSDSNSGSFDSPFRTIPKAISAAVPGDTIYLRGGRYALSSTIQINASKSGTIGSRYYLFAYPSDSARPILDFSGEGLGARGLYLKASYWYLKGLDITGAGDNGLLITGSNNIIEFCALHENQDTGLQLGGGASSNEIINCDSYNNRDPNQGNADGFAPKLDVGTGNYFYGCRSWQNSDDGWDGYLRPADSVTTTLENCWSFMNGYLKDGSPSSGNGNGFKMGGGDNGNADSLRHNMILKKCLTFDNRVKGFDQNNNRGSMTLLNCTGYRNGSNNYQISSRIRVGAVLTLTNCIALGGKVSVGTFAIQQSNSWMAPFNVTSADFVSVDTTGVRGQRKTDGSLPDVAFMHLASGSALVDAGTDAGLPFNGSAPDLGCFETEGITSVKAEPPRPKIFILAQNYPNPFNPSTIIQFEIPANALVTLKIYTMLNQEVATLLDHEQLSLGIHEVLFDAHDLATGIYVFRLIAREQDREGSVPHTHDIIRKMLLCK